MTPDLLEVYECLLERWHRLAEADPQDWFCVEEELGEMREKLEEAGLL